MAGGARARCITEACEARTSTRPEEARTYADVDIDRLMAFHQVDSPAHEDVMTSLRLIGDLITEFDR